MILSIIGIIIGWLVLGWIINFIFYAGRPSSEMGTSATARLLHIILNIAAIIAILAVIFGR